jgi:hypothetical protein
MLTPDDIERMKEVFATKEDLGAIRTSVKDILETLVLHDKHLELNDKEIAELLGYLPTKEDIHRTLEIASFVGDLERNKQPNLYPH